jgi:preprotein translocase subunit SecG
MEHWTNLIVVLHVLIALGIIGLVLLQHGKGADMGSGFGVGASSSLFGATGSANFLSRTTAVLATLFFLSSLGLAYVATNRPREGGSTVMERAQQRKQEQQQPAKPAAEPQQQPAAPAPQPGKEVPQ